MEFDKKVIFILCDYTSVSEWPTLIFILESPAIHCVCILIDPAQAATDREVVWADDGQGVLLGIQVEAAALVNVEHCIVISTNKWVTCISNGNMSRLKTHFIAFR